MHCSLLPHILNMSICYYFLVYFLFGNFRFGNHDMSICGFLSSIQMPVYYIFQDKT